MLRQCTIVLAAFVGLVVFGSARADAELIKYTGVTATASSYLANMAEYAPINAVNESGFNNTTQMVTVTTAENNSWLNGGNTVDPSPWIKCNLGAAKPIGEMWLFNNNDVLGKNLRGIQTADIWYSSSSTGGTTTPTSLPSDWTFLKNQTFTIAPGTAPTAIHTEVPIGVTAQYVLMNNIVRFTGNDGYTGLSEVEFFVPEPSTLALLVTGLIGLLCYAWRKRR